jgi:O-antigen ligase
MSTTNHTLAAAEFGDCLGALVLPQWLGIVLLWALLTTTTLDLVLVPTSGNFAADWQTLLRLGCCVFAGLYGLAYLSRTWHWLWLNPAFWSSLIVVWALFTVPSSVAPAYCATAIVMLTCVTLFVPAILHVLGPLRALQHTLDALLFFVAFNWFLYYFIPSLGRSAFEMPDGEIVYRFGNDAQQLGLQIAWAVGLLLSLTFAGIRRWRMTLPILLILAITLVRTQSRTGIITTAIVAGVVIWRWLTPNQKFYAGATALAFGAIIGFDLLEGKRGTFDGLAQAISRSGNSDEIENLTGRTEVWEDAWEKTIAAPWLGYGYGCARFLMNAEISTDFVPNHAHNLLLNTALCIGFPGATLLLMNILSMLWRMICGAGAVVCIATTFVIVAGITEPVLYGPMPRSHTVLWLMALFWKCAGGPKLSSGTTVGEVGI